MKNNALVFLLFAALGYFIGAFVSKEWNCFNWWIIGRMLYVAYILFIFKISFTED